MSPLDALRRMVAGYPGGRAAIAARLGCSDEVLRKEMSGASTHKMGLADAYEIASMCREVGGNDSDALATVFSFGAGMVRLPVVQASEDHCLSRATAHAVHESADVLLAVTRAKADGMVSANDRKEVLREIYEAVSALQKVAASLEAEYMADKRGE